MRKRDNKPEYEPSEKRIERLKKFFKAKRLAAMEGKPGKRGADDLGIRVITLDSGVESSITHDDYMSN